jgi:hypothetical protein
LLCSRCSEKEDFHDFNNRGFTQLLFDFLDLD